MEWKWIAADSGYSSIVGMDPLADWILGPGLMDFVGADVAGGAKNPLIPFIFAPLDKAAADEFNNLIVHPRTILMPRHYGVEVAEGDYVAAFAPKSFFDELAEKGGKRDAFRHAKKYIKLSLPLQLRSLPWRPRKEPNVEDPPVCRCHAEGTVVIGVIDDGIAFAHERFRARDGTTRVQYFWRQDGVYDEERSTVEFGREIWKEDLRPRKGRPGRKGIDSLLKECTTARQEGGQVLTRLVDEERFYREAGLTDFRRPGHEAVAWRLAHGTHVLDLAAGSDPAEAPTNRPIIAVQLPGATTGDTSGSGLEFYVEAAVRYILDRADWLANGGDPLPVVINFSYGITAGPHDGTSGLERSIDKSIAKRKAPLSVVLPAGNNRLSRLHAEVEHGRQELCWRIQPDDMTPTQMEIWLPPNGKGQVIISIEPPAGMPSQELSNEVSGEAVQLLRNGEVVAEARYHLHDKRGMFCILLQPTARLQPAEGLLADRVAASGVWKVHIANFCAAPLQAWIQRDDVIFGYQRRGRQSYFDEQSYTRFDPVTGRPLELDYEDDSSVPPSNVKRRGTINAIGTGYRTTVVGGLYGKELQAASYSAGGPTPTRPGPDFLSVSDDSKEHRGVLAAGSRSGSTVVMSGTSVAAPQITKRIADGQVKIAKAPIRKDRIYPDGAAKDPPPSPFEGRRMMPLGNDRPRRLD